MEDLNKRFKQEGGNVYNTIPISGTKTSQEGGGKASAADYNWKKQYLLMKVERDNLKKENNKLKKEITKLKNENKKFRKSKK